MVRVSTKISSWKSFRFWMGIKPFNMTLFLSFLTDFTLSIASHVWRVNLQPFRYNVFWVSSDEVMAINKFSRWSKQPVFVFVFKKLNQQMHQMKRTFFMSRKKMLRLLTISLLFPTFFIPSNFHKVNINTRITVHVEQLFENQSFSFLLYFFIK